MVGIGQCLFYTHLQFGEGGEWEALRSYFWGSGGAPPVGFRGRAHGKGVWGEAESFLLHKYLIIAWYEVFMHN